MFSWRFCPNCDCGSRFVRRHRRPWMRLIPASEYFSCRLCGSEFLFIFNRAIKIKSRCKAVARLHEYWSGKANRSLAIDFNFLVQFSTTRDFLNAISKAVNDRFVKECCQHLPELGAEVHGGFVLMLRGVAILVASAALDFDLLGHYRNNASFRKLLIPPGEERFPESAEILRFCRQMGIDGFSEFLSSLMEQLFEQQHYLLWERRTVCGATEPGSWSFRRLLTPKAVFLRLLNRSQIVNFSRTGEAVQKW